MNRVHINTPGKLLSFREIRGIRTPTYFDIENDALEGFKTYLMVMGVDDYTITPISHRDTVAYKKRIPKTGLKTVITGGGTPRSGMKLNVK